jgi:hypothetical protein
MKPEPFRLSYALKQARSPDGELHLNKALVESLIKLAELDEHLSAATEKLVIELKELMKMLKPDG